MSYWYADSSAADDSADGRASVLCSQSAGNLAVGAAVVFSGAVADLPSVVGDHICLHTNGNTDFGWYEVLGVGGTAPAKTLLLEHLAGTEHVTGDYDCDSGPKQTWGAIGGLNEVGGVWAAGDTAWLKAGTYELDRLYETTAADWGTRTIRRLGTGAVVLTNASRTSALVQIHANVTGGTLIVHDCTFAMGAVTSGYPIYNNCRVFSMEFHGCTFDAEAKSSANFIWYDNQTANTRSLTLRDCLFSRMGSVSIAIKLDDFHSLIAMGCSSDAAMTAASGCFVYIIDSSNYIELRNNGTADQRIRLTGATSLFLRTASGSEHGPIILWDNAVECAELCAYTYGPTNPNRRPQWSIKSNNFYQTQAASYTGIYMGQDRPTSSDGLVESKSQPIGPLEVIGNTCFQHASATNAIHLLQVGYGCPGAVVADNLVYTFKVSGASLTFGMVIKGDYISLLRNKCYGSKGIYVLGCKNTLARWNTSVSLLSYAIGLNDQKPDPLETNGAGTAEDGGSTTTLITTGEAYVDNRFNGYDLVVTHLATGLVEAREIVDWDNATQTFTVSPAFAETCAENDTYVVRKLAIGCKVLDNILVARTSGTYCMSLLTDLNALTIPTITCERNLYYAEHASAHEALMGGASKDTLAAMQAYWATITNEMASVNDTDSAAADPLLKGVAGDPDTDDWQIRRTSPAAGMAVDGGAIGAGGAESGGVRTAMIAIIDGVNQSM